ncbi:MAG: serine acetyltransferase [Rikenellaceae bacterium]|jgi:serine O-acetyltransferase|nr:serine acetyltransferase [Rikenellaceae bacterium]
MADRTKNFPGRLYKMTRAFYREVPSTQTAEEFIDSLVNLLFPVRADKRISQLEMELRWEQLGQQLSAIVTPLCPDLCCGEVVENFKAEIPLIYTGLMHDAEDYNRCDPASHCMEEVILCYPGFYAAMIHRFANVLYRLKVPILPRVISEYAHSRTGIDIHPGATIGKGFYIDHGTGIVIGETCVIGRNVKIYQGVTLGATFVDKELSGVRRHPTIGDNVIIYAGSTILGGDTVIGHDTVIGGNVWLTESVPPHSRVYHRPEIVIKGDKTTVAAEPVAAAKKSKK